MVFFYVIFFTYNIFKFKDAIKLKNRLKRLLIPYIFWPLIIFAIFNIYNLENISLYLLRNQLICGFEFIIPLWYLFSITLLSILVYILSNLFPNLFLFIIELFSIFSYYFQYSGLYNFFNIYKDNFKVPIIHTISIIPLCALGFNFASLKLVELLTKKRKMTLFFSYIFIYFILKYDIFTKLYGFCGIIYIFSSSSFFLAFYFLPLEKAYFFIQKIVTQLTRYTNGIYCMHVKVNRVVKFKFHSSGTLKNCIIIYLLSYFLSFIGNLLLGKTFLKYLFI